MAQVYQREDRDGAWYLEFRFNGRRYREYAGPPNMKKSDAEQYLAKRQREVACERIYDPKPERVTFADFAADFLATPVTRPGRDKATVDQHHAAVCAA